MGVFYIGELPDCTNMAGQQEACSVCGRSGRQRQRCSVRERRACERGEASQHRRVRICKRDGIRDGFWCKRPNGIWPDGADSLRADDLGVGHVDAVSGRPWRHAQQTADCVCRAI